MAALDFPNSPTVGQLYPAPPVAGVVTYQWDGQKWTVLSVPAGIDLGPYMLKAGGQTITGGFAAQPYNAGNLPNPFNLNPLLGNYQFGSNNGAFTLNAPTVDCGIDLLVTNTASAGAISFSSFVAAAGNTGDPLTTTNGHRFVISIRRINAVATYTIKALQ